MDHLRRTRFSPAGRERAQSDARRIAAFLRAEGAERVIGFGSAFAPDRRFKPTSDIDLAVEGLPASRYFGALAHVQDMTRFRVDIFPLESALDYLRKSVQDEGVPL